MQKEEATKRFAVEKKKKDGQGFLWMQLVGQNGVRDTEA
jgi:hypothetical protein